MYRTPSPDTPVTPHIKMTILESRLEKRLRDRVKKAGGLALKWVSPSFSGVPDRIVFLPEGKIIFVEMKAPGKKATALQIKVHAMLISLGADVRTIDSEEKIDGIFTKGIPAAGD